MAVDKLADPGCRRKLIAEVLGDPQLLAVSRDLHYFEVFAGVGSVAKAAAELGHDSATFDTANNGQLHYRWPSPCSALSHEDQRGRPALGSTGLPVLGVDEFLQMQTHTRG